jgi:hypothetical protein
MCTAAGMPVRLHVRLVVTGIFIENMRKIVDYVGVPSSLCQ